MLKAADVTTPPKHREAAPQRLPELGRRVRAARRGFVPPWSMEQLARRASLSTRTIVAIELEGRITRRAAAALARAFDLRVTGDPLAALEAGLPGARP
jgi:hypothetical protein